MAAQGLMPQKGVILQLFICYNICSESDDTITDAFFYIDSKILY